MNALFSIFIFGFTSVKCIEISRDLTDLLPHIDLHGL